MRKDYVDLVGKSDAVGTAIANTTTESALFRIPIPANELADGKTFRLRGRFKFSTTGTPTMKFRARLVAAGAAATTGVVLAESALITTESGVTNAMGEIDIDFTVWTNGASGTLMAMGKASLFSTAAPTVGAATGAAGVSAMSAGGITAPATASADFTTALDLLLTLIWGTANASNTASPVLVSVERLN